MICQLQSNDFTKTFTHCLLWPLKSSHNNHTFSTLFAPISWKTTLFRTSLVRSPVKFTFVSTNISSSSFVGCCRRQEPGVGWCWDGQSPLGTFLGGLRPGTQRGLRVLDIILSDLKASLYLFLSIYIFLSHLGGCQCYHQLN